MYSYIFIGFQCECTVGYVPILLANKSIKGQLCSTRDGAHALPAAGAVETEDICLPTCQPGCTHGCCIDANVCQCDLGYVGGK